MMSDTHDELHELAETLRRENSWWRRFWSGVIFGIGSTVGVVVILYLAVFLARELQVLPLIGSYIGKITPTLEKTLEDKVPDVTSQTKETPSNGVSGSTKLSTNYFQLTLPAGWDVKLNQTSTKAEKVKIVAETDDYTETTGAKLTVTATSGQVSTPVEAVETTPTSVDAVSAIFYRFTDGRTGETESRSVYAEHGDLTYTLTLTYQPATYPTAESVFTDILAAFILKS